MHIVCAVDTGRDASLAHYAVPDRVRLFVNGKQINSFGTRADPGWDADGAINTNLQHNIGSEQTAYTRYLDGLISSVHFIDGMSLTPAAFDPLMPQVYGLLQNFQFQLLMMEPLGLQVVQQVAQQVIGMNLLMVLVNYLMEM